MGVQAGRYELGIDLGTTYTAAAVSRDGRVEVVGLGNRAAAIPSVIYLRPDGTILTGEAASRRASAEPGRVAREFKRRMGDPTPILLGGTPYSAEALTARLMSWVIEKATELEGGPPETVAVTHPANWGPYKQDLFSQAIRLAGASAVTLSEPEAAAIAYAANERVEQDALVAVYDLGGGTFDAAVLRKTQDGFAILGQPEGIERLGGIDFDEAVFAHVRSALGGALDDIDPDDPQTVAALSRLRQECVEAKEALSTDTETSIAVLLPGLQTEVRLTRAEFEQSIRPTLTETVGALRRALTSASVEPSEVTAVLLVGGSSRIPLVAELVSDAFGRPIAVDAHPKHAIALGAAHAAALHAGSASAAGSVPVAEPVAAEPIVAEPVAAEPGVAESVGADTGRAADRGTSAVRQPAALAGDFMPRTSEELVTETVVMRTLTEKDGISPATPRGLVRDSAPPNWNGGAPAAASEAKRSRSLLWAGLAAVVILGVAGWTVNAVVLSDDGTQTAAGEQNDPADARGEDQPESDDQPGSDDQPESDDQSEGGGDTEGGSSDVPPGEDYVTIDAITLDGDTYVVEFTTYEYVPALPGQHVHFFFDTVPTEQAGVPGEGPWVLYGGSSPFTEYTTADRPSAATQMCALVANEDHSIIPESGVCHDLP